MLTNAETGLIRKAEEAEGRVADFGTEASRLKAKASQAVGDAVAEAKRLANNGRRAAENLLNDTSERVKRDPLRSVATTFAIGVGIGALAAGCLAWKRSANNSKQSTEH
jgi:ElaB/YqjD/DUF883 family membrane-anchored ribosome-binding protein